ncbi:MAG TPA: DMT family transporter [Thermoleophilaceae bacterium]|nr:DMT family transporter [Thermoleophilaceae bacterium]
MAVALGLLGVLGFSFTLPATRVAVEGLDPVFIGLGRAAVAALPATLLIAFVWREPLPDRRTVVRLGVVALGVVFGFPLLSALALRSLTSAHSAVIVGLLPAATAVMAVARAGERPSAGFWFASGAGLVAVLAFAATQGAGAPSGADLLVLGAVALGAVGYAEGGALARELGGARVICWALVLSVPITLPVGLAAGISRGLDAPADDWLGFAYVSLVSMLLAFFAWYAALARGGVAKTGQVQLVQPLLTLVWSAALLGEHVGPATIAAALAVVASVLATQRARVERKLRLEPLIASRG